MTSGSRPDQARVERCRCSMQHAGRESPVRATPWRRHRDRLGDRANMRRRRAAAAADDVDQARSAQIRRAWRPSAPGSRRIRRSAFGRPAFGCAADIACRRPATVIDDRRRIRSAPSAQFKPIDNGCAWRIEYQNASAVWPGQRAARAVGDRARDHHRQACTAALEHARR